MEQKKHLIWPAAQHVRTVFSTSPLQYPRIPINHPFFSYFFGCLVLQNFPSYSGQPVFHQQSCCLQSPAVYWQKGRTWRSKLWKYLIRKLCNQIHPAVMAKWLWGFGCFKENHEEPSQMQDVRKGPICQNESLRGHTKCEFHPLPAQLVLLHQLLKVLLKKISHITDCFPGLALKQQRR